MMMPAAANRNQYVFEDWQINLEIFCLQDSSGRELFIQPRLLKLLSVLNDNPNRVIVKEELMEKAWNEVVVGEESLSKAVFDLRKILDENFRNPPQILTIRNVGYRYEFKSKGRKSRVGRIIRPLAYFAGVALIVMLILKSLSY